MKEYAKDYLTVWAIESPKAVDKGWNAGSCCDMLLICRVTTTSIMLILVK